MKKLISTLMVTLAAIMLLSCNKTPVKTFHLTGFPNLEISYEGGSTYFGIEANEYDYWTVSTDVDWLEIKHSFGPGDQTSGNDDAVLMFYAEKWTLNSPRTANVTVKGPGGEYNKTITQNPKPLPSKPVEIKKDITSAECEEEIELPEGYWVKAVSEAPWINVIECKEGLLKVKCAANDSGQSRNGKVTIYLSDDAVLGAVIIKQE